MPGIDDLSERMSCHNAAGVANVTGRSDVTHSSSSAVARDSGCDQYGFQKEEAMKVCGKMLFAVSLVLLFAAPATNGQEKKLVPKFDPANQTTIQGVIDQVSDYECPISGKMGSHFSIKNTDETVEVHLAASKFLKEYGIVFAKGDAVQVTGTKTTFDGKPALLARQVTVGDRTYSFRDDKGIPLW